LVGEQNVAGYHLHFIRDDRTQGGHVLDCRVTRADVQRDEASAWKVQLPTTADFRAEDLDTAGSGERTAGSVH